MSHSHDPKLHLFVSLGTSPAIVPEAFLFPDVTFKAVHVLTTESPKVDLIQKFFRDKPTCLNISRVKCFTDFETEQDHFRFEEVLYRWLLSSGTRPEERYICLTGGFKTMSSAMQKAAEILGAAEVFHVLAADAPPSTIKEIIKAKEDELLRWIRLGAEQGWPQFHQASYCDYPLIENKICNDVKWLSAPDQKFREWHKEIIERSHRIASSWEELPSFPFAELATWPKRGLDWLNSPLDHKKDEMWIKALPKIELHCHLGGFATRGKQLDEVRAQADRDIPDKLNRSIPEKWPLPPDPIGLEQYRHLGDNNGSLILCDPGCLKKQCKLLYDHLCEQNIVYAEIRCSPANYVAEKLGRSPWDVLVDIRETFQSCMKDGKCHINLIIIGTRQSGGDYRAGISRHLSLAITATEHWTDENSCRVVGVDLAGYEDETTRAHYFREEFTAIHRCGLALTVHAGENDDAEGIWRAIFDLNARRLGHALNLLESKETLRSVVNRGIGIEMCPYANFQIRGGYPLDDKKESEKTYPLSKYLKEGVRVTVNTDNIGISDASLSDNLILTARLCPGLTHLEILRLQRNALDEAFVSPNLREELLKKMSPEIRFP